VIGLGIRNRQDLKRQNRWVVAPLNSSSGKRLRIEIKCMPIHVVKQDFYDLTFIDCIFRYLHLTSWET